ncbi:MAG: site-specific DNA-methyltransferase [Candidatus Diapherotrites archaeon]|nr:site-specific DNA-methyltransferase [Candidatus Diapherotrites archaeon]
MRIVERPELAKLVTFVPNKNLPVHRWFYYKEGFSRDLVKMLLDEFKPETVLDPFVGSGTTALTAKEEGIPAAGTDVLPVALLASRVKTYDYDIEETKEWIRWAMKLKPQPYSTESVRDPFVKKVFLPKTLGKILWLREKIWEEVEDRKSRDLLTLALMNASLRSSFAFKDGAVIKIRRRPLPPIENSFRRELKKFYVDLDVHPSGRAPTEIIEADARNLPFPDESFDAVITSPPYMNKIEYARVYRIEEELFFPGKRVRGMRSFVGLKLLDRGYLHTLDLYREDLRRALEEMYRVLRTGGRAAIVIAGSYIRELNLIFEADVEVAKIAEEIGFTAQEIIVARKLWATVKRTKKVGQVRESIVLLKKE